jgi:putative PEP-CTERM system histidine kinase
MGIAASFAFLGALCAAVISLTALLRARRSVSHWPLAAGMAILAVEGICSGFAAGASLPVEMIRLQRWRLLALSMLPGVWLIFGLTYARGNARTLLEKRRLSLMMACVLPAAIAIVFRENLLTLAQRSPIGFWALRLGWSGMVVYALLLIGSVLVLMNLERTFGAAVGTMRWRIKFMLLGVGVLFAVRVFTSSQALLFRGIDLSIESLNSVAMLAAAMLIVRSLFRAGNFEVDVYPSQSVLQSSITVLVAGVYLVLVGVLAKIAAYLGADAGFALKAFLVLISLVLLAVFLQSDRVRLRLSRFVSRNFQRPQYDYRTVWINFTEGTAARVEHRELCRSLVKLTADVFQALSVAIWLVDDEKDSMNLGASTFLTESGGRTHGLRQPATDLVIRRLAKYPDPVDIESAKGDWAAAIRAIHPSQFPNGGHRVCMPLINQGDVIGLITVGDRVGGSAFTLQDFDMLKCVGDHSSASLRNVQLSQKLLQAKELEAFQTMAAFFVHDLKNAASALNLMLQNLPEHFDDPVFREDSLRGISKTVGHINRLIGRLGMLRHEQGINATESDINKVVADAVSTLESGITSSLSKKLPPMPMIMLDREQMAKVVLNLVLNATEAVATGGMVRIETSMETNWAVLTVADDGCGMSPEFLNNGLFRPFKTTKKNGLGIGMFQSKMIVEAHGGRIAVASKPGKGTTFKVFLPLLKLTR